VVVSLSGLNDYRCSERIICDCFGMVQDVLCDSELVDFVYFYINIQK
jgi:hypothetical protein